jgi:6-pyruvoyltetrahydropterin/6-carboxytetrahydropterin synthase
MRCQHITDELRGLPAAASEVRGLRYTTVAPHLFRMVTLTRKTRFSAEQRFALRGLSRPANESRFGLQARPHGHDFTVEVTVAGRVDPATGMVVNISDLKPLLQVEVADRLDGASLSPEHPLLAGRQPGPEVLAAALWGCLARALETARLPARLEGVRVMEDRALAGECRRGEEGVVVTLTRSYEFAAAHRLHAALLPAGENERVFGKCNNPAGHGHNYVLEVTVGGEPDPETGLVMEVPRLDAVVHAEVVDRYDHRHLNEDVPEFRDTIPTSENLVRIIWERLAPGLGGALRRVTVRETDRNVFSYEGDPQ